MKRKMKNRILSKSRVHALIILIAGLNLSCGESDYDLTNYVNALSPGEEYSFISLELGRNIYFQLGEVEITFLQVQQHTNQNSGVMLIITYPNIPARYVELNTTTGNLSYQLENEKLIKIYLYALIQKDGVYTARLQYREFSRM